MITQETDVDEVINISGDISEVEGAICIV